VRGSNLELHSPFFRSFPIPLRCEKANALIVAPGKPQYRSNNNNKYASTAIAMEPHDQENSATSEASSKPERTSQAKAPPSLRSEVEEEDDDDDDDSSCIKSTASKTLDMLATAAAASVSSTPHRQAMVKQDDDMELFGADFDVGTASSSVFGMPAFSSDDTGTAFSSLGRAAYSPPRSPPFLGANPYLHNQVDSQPAHVSEKSTASSLHSTSYNDRPSKSSVYSGSSIESRAKRSRSSLRSSYSEEDLYELERAKSKMRRAARLEVELLSKAQKYLNKAQECRLQRQLLLQRISMRDSRDDGSSSFRRHDNDLISLNLEPLLAGSMRAAGSVASSRASSSRAAMSSSASSSVRRPIKGGGAYKNNSLVSSLAESGQRLASLNSRYDKILAATSESSSRKTSASAAAAAAGGFRHSI